MCICCVSSSSSSFVLCKCCGGNVRFVCECASGVRLFVKTALKTNIARFYRQNFFSEYKEEE